MIAKILVVEDEPALSEAYKMILKSHGYEVDVAHDGDEALDKTEKYEPDLILLDLRMPKMNGLEFLEKYDIHGAHPNVKVILFTNYSAQKDIDRAYELGAERYIIKSWVSPKELIKLVGDVLSLA